jgi:hypothetical protein
MFELCFQYFLGLGADIEKLNSIITVAVTNHDHVLESEARRRRRFLL